MPPINRHSVRQHHCYRSAWPVGLAVAFFLGTLLSALAPGGQRRMGGKTLVARMLSSMSPA